MRLVGESDDMSPEVLRESERYSVELDRDVPKVGRSLGIYSVIDGRSGAVLFEGISRDKPYGVFEVHGGRAEEAGIIIEVESLEHRLGELEGEVGRLRRVPGRYQVGVPLLALLLALSLIGNLFLARAALFYQAQVITYQHRIAELQALNSEADARINRCNDILRAHAGLVSHDGWTFPADYC
jgi:hypothetical protein